MANWNVALNWLLDNEDFKRAYKVVPDAPPGAFAISGVNSAAFPQDFDAISKLMISERGVAVQAFYYKNFWNNWFAQLTSDDLCKRVFDFAVNAGSVAAVRCLQEAVNDLKYHNSALGEIAEDGRWGPLTLDTANGCDQSALVGAFQQARVAHYRTIVAKNPADERYLVGWLARAKR